VAKEKEETIQKRGKRGKNGGKREASLYAFTLRASMRNLYIFGGFKASHHTEGSDNY